jgi:hypothetical protein
VVNVNIKILLGEIDAIDVKEKKAAVVNSAIHKAHQ